MNYKSYAQLEQENKRLLTAIEGYRRDLDNCLAELRHKNNMLRDRSSTQAERGIKSAEGNHEG